MLLTALEDIEGLLFYGLSASQSEQQGKFSDVVASRIILIDK